MKSIHHMPPPHKLTVNIHQTRPQHYIVPHCPTRLALPLHLFTTEIPFSPEP